MESFKIKVGVLGTSNIAKKNIRAINSSHFCELAGIASRTRTKAEAYVEQLNLKQGITIYSSYDELIADEDIDVIYIPLPTSTHLEWVEKTAIAEKHIILEKPTAINVIELSKMIQIAKKNGVLIMDGVMFMHHHRTQNLMNYLNDPYCGKVSKIFSSFSFNGNDSFLHQDIRVKKEGDPLGCLGDLGWYCIRLGIMVFNKGQFHNIHTIKLPTKCIATCTKWSNEGVPLDCYGRVSFNTTQQGEGWDNEVLNFDCSFITPFRQSYEIICPGNSTEGIVDKIFRCDDFVLPRESSKASFNIEIFPTQGPFTDHATRMISQREVIESISHDIYDRQEVKMFDTFATLIIQKETNCGTFDEYHYWLRIALVTQMIVDACYTSMKSNGAEISIDPQLFYSNI